MLRFEVIIIINISLHLVQNK